MEDLNVFVRFWNVILNVSFEAQILGINVDVVPCYGRFGWSVCGNGSSFCVHVFFMHFIGNYGPVSLSVQLSV